MRSQDFHCALTGAIVLAFAGSAEPARGQSAFRGGLVTTVHNVVDLIEVGAAEGRARCDIRHLHNALNQLLHVVEKGNSQRHGSMSKGMAGAHSSKGGKSNANRNPLANKVGNATANRALNNRSGNIAANNKALANNATNRAPNNRAANNVGNAVWNNVLANNSVNGFANNKAGNFAGNFAANVGNAKNGNANNSLVKSLGGNKGLAQNFGNAKNGAGPQLNQVIAKNGCANANRKPTNNGQNLTKKGANSNRNLVGMLPGTKSHAKNKTPTNNAQNQRAAFGNVKNTAFANFPGNCKAGANSNLLNNIKNGQGPAAKNVCAKNGGRLSSTANLAKGFPNLGNFKVLDNSGKNYNCISATLGMNNQWINPKTGPANAPLAYMDKLYAANGFQRQMKPDLRPDPRNQKVAVYATKKPNGGIDKITHAALQQPNGTWTSKLGKLPLIQHKSAWSVAGPNYGMPIATYVRPNAGSNVGQKAINRRK